MTKTEFYEKTLAIFAKADTHDSLWWKEVDDKDGNLFKFFVNCNDFFWWGCADLEEVTPENIAMLEQSFEDVSWNWIGALLFCARARAMRPQGAAYDRLIDKKDWPLFDAAGPAREIDIGNPYTPTGDYLYAKEHA